MVWAFGVAWWLGLYLLVRNPANAVLRLAGLGLLSYGLALALDDLPVNLGVLPAARCSSPGSAAPDARS